MEYQMKKLLLATAALAIMATAASAADLPQRQVAPAPYVPVAPAFTWTGFYLGLNAGYAWTHSDGVSWADSLGGVANFKSDRDGFIGGAQAGYNWQFGQFVVGAETDIQYTDLKKRSWDVFGNTTRLDTSYLGTVRARLGFVPMDRALLYVTGGLAYGDTKLEAWNANLGVGASKRDTNVGWTLGAGVEYAITNNITTKLEYLYYDLGDTKLAFGDGLGNVAAYKADNRGSIVRAGLNYKF
jgi:outer membrane immunogenic protein